MSLTVSLVAPEGALADAIVAETARTLNAAGGETSAPRNLSIDRAVELDVAGLDAGAARAAVEGALADAAIDRCVTPSLGRRKRLLIADMDSTILANETLDEISAEAGVGDIVAEITARSMRGEMNFEDSLRERVALLEGRNIAIIETVLERISLNPGAEAFIATMRHHGAYTALVSGGFTMFTDRVRAWLGFHISKANDFEIRDGLLTGRLEGGIVGRETKLEWLDSLGREHGVPAADALTIGDGANDLAMINAAGLGVAYRGKPILREAANARIDHTDLRTALYFQGYGDDEILEKLP